MYYFSLQRKHVNMFTLYDAYVYKAFYPQFTPQFSKIIRRHFTLVLLAKDLNIGFNKIKFGGNKNAP